MSLNTILANARIFVGVAIGAFGIAMFVRAWGEGLVAPALPLLFVVIGAAVVVGPRKIIRARLVHEKAFHSYLRDNPDLRIRVERGRRVAAWGYACYGLAAVCGLVTGWLRLPFLLSLIPLVIGAFLHLRGNGEIAAVEGQFLRDSSPQE